MENLTNLITSKTLDNRQGLGKLKNAKISLHIFRGVQCVWLTLKH